MRKEEEYIRRKCGSRTPFRVPEGYFENFTRQLMEKLPEKAPKAPTADCPTVIGHRRRTWWYAAAAVCGLTLLGGSLYLTNGRTSLPADTTQNQPVADYTGKEDTDETLYDELDYAMVDNQEIAMYLTEAY